MSLIAVLELAVVCFAFYLEPTDGDLTRMLGYSENDYGWQQQQVRFSEQLYAKSGRIRDFNTVVVGDSFSLSEENSWLNWLVVSTNLNLVAFHSSKLDMTSFLASEEFQRNPPRLLIYEIVERNIGYKLASGNKATCNPRYDTAPAIEISERLTASVPHFRQTVKNLSDVDLNLGASYLDKKFYRLIELPVLSILPFYDDNAVGPAELTRSDLFSNRESGQILYVGDDLLKRTWKRGTYIKAGCQLLRWQNMVQANGVTHFVAVIAPDKLTAYAPYLKNESLRNLSSIEELESVPGLRIVNLLGPIRRAIASGEKDIYLPNDTHWGAAGQQIASDAVVDHLKKFGVFVELRHDK